VTGSMWLHIGANMDQRERVYIGTMTSRASAMRNTGSKKFVSISTPDGANRPSGSSTPAEAGQQCSARTSARTRTGSSTREGLAVGAENCSLREPIRDADMAEEMVEYTKTRSWFRPRRPCWPRPTTKTQNRLTLFQ